jgi:tetratricopeptide (TPR) repeat protein
MSADFNSEASRLIGEDRLVEAREMLEHSIQARPADWNPTTEDDKFLRIAFWDKEEFLAYSSNLPASHKSVLWVRPSFSLAFFHLCFIDITEGSFESAVASAAAGLQLEPDHPDLLIYQGLALSQLNRLPESLESYKRAATSRPWTPPRKRAQALLGQGGVLITLRRLDEAETVLRQSLDLDSRYPTAAKQLAYIELLRGESPHR